MAMRKPIILGVAGEAREIVEEAEAGLSFEPENAASLAAVVLKLAGDTGLARALGENGRRYVVAHFDRRLLASLLQRVLARVCRAPVLKEQS